MQITPGLTIAANLVSIVSVISAAGLALYDKPVWGFFLFVALITACYPKKDKDDQ